MHQIITCTKELETFCQEIARAAEETPSFITVDTEFIRENTFWPKVCLIQVASASKVAAIDPLAETLDLEPLFSLLANPSILKVFHAARQDMEIFWHLTGKVPFPIYDTQIAAMVCGYGESVGYEALVASLTGKSLDKSARFTDWSRRPLTKHQLDYALADVILLRDVYLALTQHIKKQGREEWIQEETEKLYQPETYEVAPEEAWRRLKYRSTKPRFLAALRELARLREIEARKVDLPRSRILRDDLLVEVALQMPQDIEALEHIRGISHGFGKSAFGQTLLKGITEAKHLPLSECPKKEEENSLPPRYEPLLDLLKMLLKITADSQKVAAKLIATRQSLEALILYGLGYSAGEEAQSLLSGWRHEVFGKQALNLIKGKVSIVWRKQAVCFITNEPEKSLNEEKSKLVL